MARKGASKGADAAPARLASRTLVLDNGAHTIKAGFSPLTTDSEPHADAECHVVANCIARSQRDKRTYIGPELLEECWDFGELAFRRPVEKGFVVNWEGEQAIWERTLLDKRSPLQCDPHEMNLILTEAPNGPSVLQRNMDEMVFEEFEFASYYRTISPVLNAYVPPPFPSTPALPSGTAAECLLVVDVGHSHTTTTPLHHGRPLHAACRRLEIGGKTLTNRLKEVLSRTVEVQKEDWIVQEIKEDVCFISQSFSSDLERVWKGGLKDPRDVDTSIVVDYVLPDYEAIKRGFSRPHDTKVSRKDRALGLHGGPREHIVTIANERFTVPELLFTPSDIGMQQEGVAGTILQSIYSLPQGLWQPFLANILVVGGSSKFPGFLERLRSEMESRVSEEYLVRVAQAEDPLKNVWAGGARLARSKDALSPLVVTRQEYLEHGDVWTRRKFAGKV
ncbi:actin-related protein, ARP6 class [Neohortaea acidophila]|uniref:Actin-like protein ARP6 n=1 Tax=Neohortaea acidophila TaxID=245834 RepID=A0A6A6Q7R0_9PEZI|nr:actin-related protein, ARP6 class [Neohortaea acidophila]KAF2488034.1 actin-related protein, ARP6 class [Neohortaea acidophila]